MGLAFVTGASRGLGREVARGLIAAGHEVMGISMDAGRASAAASELGISFETADLADVHQARSLSERLIEKYGVPQIVVLAHGVMTEKMAKTLRTTDAEWARVMNINLNSVFPLAGRVRLRIFVVGLSDLEKTDFVVFAVLQGISGIGNSPFHVVFHIRLSGV